MKNLVLLIILSSSFNMYAQCPSGRIPAKHLRNTHGQTYIKADFVSKYKTLIGKLDMAVTYSFVKAGEEMYVYMYIERNSSKDFQLLRSNAFQFKAEEGKQIKLYPFEDFSGGRFIGRYHTGAYYKISREELEFLSKYEIKEISFEVSAENSITGGLGIEGGIWRSLGDGVYRFSTQIAAPAKRTRLIASASCFSSIL